MNSDREVASVHMLTKGTLTLFTDGTYSMAPASSCGVPDPLRKRPACNLPSEHRRLHSHGREAIAALAPKQ